MKKKVDVSVIIPVYNTEKYLKKCLDSIINQEYQVLEIIVINDGSTDNSKRIINNYMKKYNNIVYFEKSNSGQASARNLGLQHAKGKYISFIDSDDYVEKDLYKELDKYMDKNYDIIIFDYNYIFSDHNRITKGINCKDENKVTIKEYLLCTNVSPCNKLFKRKYLKISNFLFPEGIIYEDYASIPTLVLNNPKICYLNKSFYNYIQSDESTMRTDEYKTKYEDIFPATLFLYDKLKIIKEQEELEFQICVHTLYHSALNFYKYKKYEQISKLSDLIKILFPNWQKNKYIKELRTRERTLMLLFYKKSYRTIKIIQKLKNGIKIK